MYLDPFGAYYDKGMEFSAKFDFIYKNALPNSLWKQIQWPETLYGTMIQKLSVPQKWISGYIHE